MKKIIDNEEKNSFSNYLGIFNGAFHPYESAKEIRDKMGSSIDKRLNFKRKIDSEELRAIAITPAEVNFRFSLTEYINAVISKRDDEDVYISNYQIECLRLSCEECMLKLDKDVVDKFVSIVNN